MLSESKLALFGWNNYKFSTSEKGRLTSLYFEDEHGNQGRWRREHPDGPLLVYQTQSLRLFIAPVEVENFTFGLEAHDIRWDKESRFGYRAFGDYKVLQKGVAIQNLSLAPKVGWHVLELCPPTYYPRHGSSRTVILNDGSAAGADFGVLKRYTSEQISDWS